jgi:hypothetical protein
LIFCCSTLFFVFLLLLSFAFDSLLAFDNFIVELFISGVLGDAVEL